MYFGCRLDTLCLDKHIPFCRGVFPVRGGGAAEMVVLPWILVWLFFILIPSPVVSQPYSFITDPSDDTQPIYVMAKEGLNVSLYCFVFNEGAGANGEHIRTGWQTKRTNETMFVTVPFSSDVSIGPAYLTNRIEVTGLPQGIGTFRTNFTLLNFTDDLNLISFRCGQPNEDGRIFTLGLSGKVMI